MIDELKQWEYDKGYERGKADSLNNAVKFSDVLQEIRQEIAQIKATQLYSTIDLKDMVLAIIDKHMEEHHD